MSTEKRGSARRLPSQTWHQAQKAQLTSGERAADRMRNFMGSWRFVGGFILFMLAWAFINDVMATRRRRSVA